MFINRGGAERGDTEREGGEDKLEWFGSRCTLPNNSVPALLCKHTPTATTSSKRANLT